ncbi:MAG TPA: hypothetical protein VHN37_08815 [Actinomycetota bacterium]|nr:hypothetical protein [Actinomycetota bacterium]
MPEISMSPAERERIDAAAAELEPTIAEFFEDARPSLSCEEWETLVCYARACVRRAVEIGTLLHGVVDSQCPNAIPYPGRGRDVFLRDALAAWRDAFAPMPQVWKLAPVTERIAGGEKRVLADVATLEVMAANRAFGSLDQQCQALLSRGR